MSVKIPINYGGVEMYVFCILLCVIIMALIIIVKKLMDKIICLSHELNLAYQIITKEQLDRQSLDQIKIHLIDEYWKIL